MASLPYPRCQPRGSAVSAAPNNCYSSHGFLLRRVWHLAIPTPPAMGYYPTEYAEFTEPPAEKSLPRISQIYTDGWGALFSHRIHRIHRIWQRGYGRDAIPSYICAHPCHLWEALLSKRFCVFGAFRGSFFTACFVGAVLALASGKAERRQLHSLGWQRGYGRDAIPSYICAFRAFCGSPFSARSSVYSVYSVGASSPLVRLVQQRLLHPLA